MHKEITQYRFNNVSDSIRIEDLNGAFFEFFWFYKSDFIKVLENEIFEINNKEAIVLVIQKNQCLQCIQSIIMDFEILQMDTKFKNFFIIGDFDKNEEFIKVTEKLITNLSYVKIHYKFDFPFECQYPSIFVWDNDHYPKYFFVPGLFPDLREEYFYKIIYNYLNSKPLK